MEKKVICYIISKAWTAPIKNYFLLFPEKLANRRYGDWYPTNGDLGFVDCNVDQLIAPLKFMSKILNNYA